jgi:hypothetical protein
MADEPTTTSAGVIRGINWRETFPFTNIFRAFRIAVHPSKLVLGLVALLILYAGGRFMDWVWPTASLANHSEVRSYGRLVNAEPNDLVAREQRANYSQAIRDAREANVAAYEAKLKSEGIVADANKTLRDHALKFDHAKQLRVAIQTRWQKAHDSAYATFIKDDAAADKIPELPAKLEAKKKARTDFDEARGKADSTASAEFNSLERLMPRGIFDAFFEYEVGSINAAAKAITENHWFARELIVDDRVVTQPGAITHLTNVLTVGPVWLWKYHTVYAAIFTVLFLLVWAVFGGAISRIAAVQVARDEKISVRQALQFSINKVLSFAFAPLIPLGIVLALGALVAVGGLLYYIPVIGPIVGGALMILALIAGVVITLVLFGTVGGFNLMFPTIAVEGSDSFDAISRSFSYVFARPWRMLFYTVVALIYFALTYLFVRYFVYIVLAVTHFFVTWFLGGRPGYYFEWMWPAPTNVWELPYDVNGTRLAWSESTASFLMSFWNYLFIGLVGAFAISFYLSVNTIIYALMRREVDATELEDVYVEETEDDFVEPSPAIPPLSPAPSVAAPSAPASGGPSFSPPTIVGETSSYTPPPSDQPPQQG